ncbi:ribosome small subunit-dependent GTPase A [[Clostridium] aminophilum]|uniref:Small ribosomal subunit biogenesis GTPase RsgA n=1 Tax=[Clostridium] aminophilum TaxID=1526 RepID=A0A1I6INK1_9FIRM|nr:ribosome small subunit-dependent GTPase A [[Clostridium] aminophilum]SFR68189.1 ribosome biogenesis GTPase [[Clostridium] aminophilum]
MQGKIVKGIAGFYYVHDGIGSVYECRAKGVFRNRKEKPLVGDDVEITVLDEKNKTGNVERILPRKNSLIRPAVANVDQALVVFAVTDPEPNLNLLDRFLVMMRMQKVPVIIAFSKADLTDSDGEENLRRIYEHAGCTVCFFSTRKQLGLDRLDELLAGKTTVLAGPSGVGKSSLTNHLQPDAEMEIGELSRKISRGKNTTRHSELFFVKDGTFVCDTPGFSSIYVDGIEARDLQAFYPEFSAYEDRCRFLGCVHVGERECGVKDAVAAGTIAASRYENYLLIYEELRNKRRY